MCLTFGPTNGPEDFAFATDRVFAPGRGRKMRFCSNWQIYADDITIRSGTWIDGVYYSDGERAERLRQAQKQERTAQPLLSDAFKALGFDPTPLGAEKDGKQAKPKKRAKTEPEQAQEGLTPKAAGDPSPRAHLGSALLSSVPLAADAGLFTLSSDPCLEQAADAGDYVTVAVSQAKDIVHVHKSPPMRMYAVCRLRVCLLYTSPSPRDGLLARMPSSA